MRLPSRARKRPALILAVPAAIAALALSGCATFVTGGGFIQSTAGGGGKANFGFTYDQTKGRFSGTYHDKDAAAFPNGGVKLSFTGTPVGPSGTGSCMSDTFSYRSTSPAYSGTGSGYYEACDNGEGKGTTDSVSIYVGSGPYSGYGNRGAGPGGQNPCSRSTPAGGPPPPAAAAPTLE